MLNQWITELRDRILPENVEIIRSLTRLDTPDASSIDEERWNKVNTVRRELMKDEFGRISLFAQLRQAIEKHDYPEISRLQQQMNAMMRELKVLYNEYRRNLF